MKTGAAKGTALWATMAMLVVLAASAGAQGPRLVPWNVLVGPPIRIPVRPAGPAAQPRPREAAAKGATSGAQAARPSRPARQGAKTVPGTPLAGSMTWFPTVKPAPPNETSGSVCVSGGILGVNGKICVGPSGYGSSVSYGHGVSAGVSRKIGSDGSNLTCVQGSGTLGAGKLVTGSIGECTAPNGRQYDMRSGGAGVGVGTEGWKLGVTVEGTSLTPRPPAARAGNGGGAR